MKIKELLAVSKGISEICIIKDFEVVARKGDVEQIHKYVNEVIHYIEVDNDKTLIINVK